MCGDFCPVFRNGFTHITYRIARRYTERAEKESCRACIVLADALFIGLQECHYYVLFFVEGSVVFKVVCCGALNVGRNFAHYVGIGQREALFVYYALQKLRRALRHRHIIAVHVLTVGLFGRRIRAKRRTYSAILHIVV